MNICIYIIYNIIALNKKKNVMYANGIYMCVCIHDRTISVLKGLYILREIHIIFVFTVIYNF